MRKIDIPDKIKLIMNKFIKNGYEIYIVGGAIRDILLGKNPHDWDLFTNATGDEILKIFPSGKVMGGEERQAKILTVVVDGVEISEYRVNGDRTQTGGTIADHINTCDFTINAMACNIRGEILDLVGGENDLKSKTLKAVGNPSDRITEDPLRIMRGFRFINKYDLKMDITLALAIDKHIKLIGKLPPERIKNELFKMLKWGCRYINNIMTIICPEFVHLRNIDGGLNHAEDVNKHSIEAYRAGNVITNNPLLLFAILFHDIGKGIVVEKKKDGSNTFPSHEMEGYKFMKDWMKKNKWGLREIKYISTLIRCHMYDSKMSKKGYLKLFKRIEDNNVPVEHLLMMRYADSCGNLKKKVYKYGDKSKQILATYYEYKFSREPFRITDLEINGNDLIKRGFKGKAIGNKLKELFDLVQDGKLDNERLKLLTVIKTEINAKYDKESQKVNIHYPSSWKMMDVENEGKEK